MKTLSEFLIRLIYPEACHHCKKTLELDERALCKKCASSFQGEIYDFLDCEESHHSPYLRHLWHLADYNFMTKELLTAYKFEKQTHLIHALRPSITNFYSGLQSERVHDLVLPVPSSLPKKMSRFCCCSEEIARIIASQFKIPIDTSLLRKRLGVPSQSQLKEEERLANMYGAFKISHSEVIKGQRILIVDDIYTTGTTLKEIARILMNAGAQVVDGFTFARTRENKKRKTN